jgi:hypothetical protein
MFDFVQVQLECEEVGVDDEREPVIPISPRKHGRAYSSSDMPISIGKFISSKRKECVKRKLVFDDDVGPAKAMRSVSGVDDCDDV